MKSINIHKLAGEFAENKDVARNIRQDTLLPTLESGTEIEMDFSGVAGTTQSFIHALISEAIRKYGSTSLDLMVFKNCEPEVREIIETVIEYMQEA